MYTPDDPNAPRVVTRLVLVGDDGVSPQPVVPPALRAAARARIRGRDMAVLVELHEHLCEHEWRVVRGWYVADALCMKQEHVTRALRRLEIAGLLTRDTDDAGVFHYRLPAAHDVLKAS